MSSVLLGAPAPALGTSPPGVPPGAGPVPPSADGRERGSAVTIIAGVGVLLLAMGVGVLIGRSGSGGGQTVAAAPQVVTVPAASAGATGGGSPEAAFSDDWPAGKDGYTVQLQALPLTGTQTSAVAAAKSAASEKGAKAVGALKSDDFSSLKAGSYIVYSGVYAGKAQAAKALKTLKQSFPGAEVIHVSSGGSSSASATAGGAKVSSSPNHPAPAKAVEKALKQPNGKNYETESNKLPDQIVTE